MSHQNSRANQQTTKESSTREDKSMFKLSKLFSLTLIAFFGALLMVSCDSVNSNTDKDQPKEREITAEMMKNPKNPYDEKDETHNKFLDYFAEATAKDTAIDQKQLPLIIEKFYAQNKMEFGGEQMQGYEQLFDTYSKLGLGMPGPIFPRPTDYLCRVFPTLCDILTPNGPFRPFLAQGGDLDDENGGTSTERTLKFIETTKAQEAKALESKELDDEHRKAILSQLAVARYSAAYWHNVVSIQKEESAYYKPFTEVEAAAICHVCDVVGADAAGAVVGSLVPGVGTGVGAGVSSAASVIEKLFW